jgi:PAS domain S-box-containing protein
VQSLIDTLLTVHKHSSSVSAPRNDWFESMAEDLPHFVWSANANGIKTFCSKKYLAYTGALSSDSLNSWIGFIHPEDRPRAKYLWQRSLQADEPYEAEYRLRRWDGTYRLFRACAQPVRNDAGVITGWLGVSTDVEDEKRSEQQRETEAKLAAVRRLASSIAHEINNPLEGIMNAVYLALRDSKLEPSTREYLQLAENELQRVARLTTNSLKFHKQLAPPSAVDLREVMATVLTTYSNRIRQHNLIITEKYRSAAPVFCSRDEMLQVFGTLVQNSLDASSIGSCLEIEIRNARDPRDRSRTGVRVTVADTGHGISAEVRHRIFEPFFTTRDATRTGLALWIADQIIRRHSGTITFRSRTGQPKHGTVFAVFLPIGI